MSEAEEGRDRLEVLAADFMERRRHGESPPISEYTARCPDLAAEIEEVFPTIVVMERLKVHKQTASGACATLGAVKLDRLGDFRILDEIGRGGMGIVYHAYQESLGRHVAVKVLPRQSLLDSKQLQRFQREAQTAARLHHNNIVPVFGVGEHEGFHYIAMQLIRGTGLDAVLAKLQQVASSENPAIGEEGAVPSCSGRKDAEEVARLARAMVEGRFHQPEEMGLSSDTSDAGPDGGGVAAMGKPSRTIGAATEDFKGGDDTEVTASASGLLWGRHRASPLACGMALRFKLLA